MARTEAQKQADRKYQKEKTINLCIRLSRITDNEIIQWLDQQSNKRKYILDLIKNDMKNK